MNKLFNYLKTIIFLSISTFIYAIAINMFLKPASIFSTGTTGIAQIITHYFKLIPLGTMTLILNIPLFILAIIKLGKKFTIRSIFFLVLSSILVDILPSFSISNDMMLNSIFSGLLLGIAASIAFLNEASTGGLDFLVAYIRTVNHNLSLGNIFNFFNFLIFTFVGFTFNFELAMYSVITAYITSITLDKIYTSTQKTTLMIITSNDDIAKKLNSELIRGVTILKGIGSYTQQDKNVLFTTVRKDEISIVRKIVNELDQSAFINLLRADAVYGQFIEK